MLEPTLLDLPTATYSLRPYQREAVDAGLAYLRRKSDRNGLMILPTGSGKSLVIANLVKELGEPCLVFQPSYEILVQNVAKYLSYGNQCSIYSASAGEKVMSNVTFATIGSVIKRLHLLSRFKYVIIDECFPAGTMIDGKPIEMIQPGDIVDSYNHYTQRVERRKVVRLFRHKRRTDLVKVTLTNGTSFVCTYNHPVHTVEDGYIPAGFLTNETVLFQHGTTKTEEGVCQLRNGLQPHNAIEAGGVLLDELCAGTSAEETCQGLCDVPRLRNCYGDHRVSEGEFQQDGQGVLQQAMQPQIQIQASTTITGATRSQFGADEAKEPHVDAGREGEDDREFTRQDIPFQGRQRSAQQAPAHVAFGNWPGDGACHRDGDSEGHSAFATISLQGGLSGAIGEIGNRGGRSKSPAEEVEVPRPSENDGLERVRVASVEVYQRASGDGDQEVCEDDTVYNFEVEGNHNYFANGVLVHNCHAVNAEGGMYEKLISTLGVRVLGLTATPYRLSNGIDQRTQRGYSILKFLTRTRPRIFEDVVYYVQNRRLFDDGHLSKMVYYPINAIQRQNLQVNSTGSGYTEKSEKAVYRAANMPVRLVKCVNRLIELNRKNGLVFTRFVEEARLVAANIPGAAVVSADTPDKERERVINGFSAGRIRWICNVGILTTGVDFPDLESVVMGRATRSLAQWYQIVGRGVRTHPDKKDCMVIDYGGNYDQFGPVEDLELSDEGGWHIRSHGRGPLTGIPFGDRYVPKRS